VPGATLWYNVSYFVCFKPRSSVLSLHKTEMNVEVQRMSLIAFLRVGLYNDMLVKALLGILAG
jgi:hypothetical protein